MAKYLYHVGLRISDGPIDIPKLESHVGLLGDWVRISAFDWYLSTDIPAKGVTATVRRCLKPDDTIVVIALDPDDYDGYAPQWFWTWLSKQRKPKISGAFGPR